MPSIKIYPPSRLPDSDVTETQFNMWQEELEVYLSQEADYKVFLPDKLYSTWSSYEENRDRIRNLKPRDIVAANDVMTLHAVELSIRKTLRPKMMINLIRSESVFVQFSVSLVNVSARATTIL